MWTANSLDLAAEFNSFLDNIAGTRVVCSGQEQTTHTSHLYSYNYFVLVSTRQISRKDDREENKPERVEKSSRIAY